MLLHCCCAIAASPASKCCPHQRTRQICHLSTTDQVTKYVRPDANVERQTTAGTPIRTYFEAILSINTRSWNSMCSIHHSIASLFFGSHLVSSKRRMIFIQRVTIRNSAYADRCQSLTAGRRYRSCVTSCLRPQNHLETARPSSSRSTNHGNES